MRVYFDYSTIRIDMRHTIRLTADDGESTVQIRATINTGRNLLSSNESNKVKRELADRLMQTLPGLPYTDFRLSEIR